MKYEFKRVESTQKFKPFSLTLTFESHEEYENFHNNAMGKITKTTLHQFHTDVFRMGVGEIDSAEGDIK